MPRISTTSARLAALVVACIVCVTIALPYVNAQDATPEATPSEQVSAENGGVIFNSVCVACHQVDGNGIGGIYLPLNNNGLVTADDPSYLIRTVLTGRGGMPRFDSTYTDAELASVLTYVRQNWDNDASAVTEEQVAAIRAELDATPVVSPTPEGQIPEGQIHPDQRSTPQASPNATPTN